MKVTVGELLGIAKQAKALNWQQLATEFKKVEKINALKNTAAAQLSTTFASLLDAFSVGKKVMNIIQEARPILTMAVRIKGAFRNPMYIGEIANETALLIQKVILSLAQYGIGQVRDFILGITIDLGDLSSNQIKNLRNKIQKALSDSFDSIQKGINNFSPSVLAPNLFSLGNSINELIDEMSKKEAWIITSSSGSNINELSNNILKNFSDSVRKDNRKKECELNTIVYGSCEAPLLPEEPSYYTQSQSTFFPETEVDLDELENPTPENSGDESWQDRIGEDNAVTRELMDEIEKTLKNNLGGLLNSINQELRTVEIDTTDIEKDIYKNNQNPENDIGVLHNLKDGFLNNTLDTQLSLVKSAFDSMLKMNDAFLKKIINKFIKELLIAFKDRNNLIYSKLEKFIASLLSSGITDMEELKRKIMEFLLALQNNLRIDFNAIYKKVLYEYLLYIFSNTGVNNEERTAELIEMAINKFYQLRLEFLNSLLVKILSIRLSNEVIDEDYFITTYDVLRTNLLIRLTQILETTNSIAYDGTYKYDGSFTYGENPLIFDAVKQEILSNFNTIIIEFFTTITENTHPLSKSILEKINTMEFNLVDTIKHLTLNEPVPLNVVWEEPEWADLTETEKQTLSSILYAIFMDYKNRIIKVVADAIYYDKYELVKVLKKEKAEFEVNQHILNQDTVIKNKLNIKSGELINSFEYTGNYEETKGIIENKTAEFLNTFNYSLQQDFKLASLLKENEVSILESLPYILESI